MKLEYLATGTPECPLLRLFQFTPVEAGELRTAMDTLASGSAQAVAVHKLPFIEALEGCELELVVKKWDQGVARAAGPLAFTFGLKQERWKDIAGLLEPFTRLASGYQWLLASVDECSVLLSATGKW